jgi:hypothetical protein
VQLGGLLLSAQLGGWAAIAHQASEVLDMELEEEIEIHGGNNRARWTEQQ